MMRLMDKQELPPFYLRRLRQGDSQINVIDREAFPENVPPPNYLREMHNGLAFYAVSCDGIRSYYHPETPPPGRWARYRRITTDFLARHLVERYTPPAGSEYLTGFSGIWVMAGEAHLTTIAVRQADRGQGLGELLLIGAVQMAYRQGASFVTLETRASNVIAQNLYRRYGFDEVGVRRGYYTDNREDAVLMTTPQLATAEYQQKFVELTASFGHERGVAPPEITD